MATPAPAKKPNLIKNDRICRCLGGAMATPAGFEAAPPVTSIGGATAVPLGCCGVWACGFEVVGAGCAGVVFSGLEVVDPGFSGSSTGGCMVLGDAGAVCEGAVCSGGCCCASSGSAVQLTKIKKLPAIRATV
jgi:hypothetical protein